MGRSLAQSWMNKAVSDASLSPNYHWVCFEGSQGNRKFAPTLLRLFSQVAAGNFAFSEASINPNLCLFADLSPQVLCWSFLTFPLWQETWYEFDDTLTTAIPPSEVWFLSF